MKKLLFCFMALTMMTSFSSCKWIDSWFNPNKPNLQNEKRCNIVTERIKVPRKNGQDSLTIQRSWCQNEFIISYCTDDTSVKRAIHHYLDSLKYELRSTCACSNQLELWYSPVGLIPDGDDVKKKEGPVTSAGWEIMRNFLTTEPTDSTEFLASSGDNIKLRSNYFTGYKPTTKVIVAIDDSGVDEVDDILNPVLYRNQPPLLFCGTSTPEGQVGMNILKVSRGELSSEPSDIDGHGTFIGGIVAGAAEPKDFVCDNQSVQVEQIHARFVTKRGISGDLFSALCGVHYAINKGAQVINTSWRVRTASPKEEDTLRRIFCPTLQAIKYANILMVTGAGNDTMDLDGVGKAWPAAFATFVAGQKDYSDHVISVGAWNTSLDKIAYFSNYGSFVNIYAQGTDISSTGFDNRTTPFIHNRPKTGKGTSYSAPFVSRTAAILMGLHPRTGAKKVKAFILKYSKDRPEKDVIMLDVGNIMGNHVANLR